jgi:hypothetical protein
VGRRELASGLHRAGGHDVRHGDLRQPFTSTVVPVPGALLLFATDAGVFGVFARGRRAV